MNCVSCGTEAPAEARYCMMCGTSLQDAPGVCPHCEAQVRASDCFCCGCGGALREGHTAGRGAAAPDLQRLMPRQYVKQLLSTRGRAISERRVVTILFADVVGSTAMSEDLDPELVLEIMSAALQRLMEPVFSYEGTLARLTGDGLLCFFGAPLAHEDDPVRACRAGLEIVAAAESFGRQLEAERGIPGFAVRVGINTGLVVVGEVGSDLRVEYTAMGDAVNIAARVESEAAPGTVLLTEATARRIGHLFDLEDRGPVTMRGKSVPVRVYQLSRYHGNHRGLSPHGLRSPLVGRDDELQALQGALRSLEDNRGSRVVITGDPGLGKSRLLSEARQFLRDNARWIEGHANSYMERSTYAIARELLCNLAGIDRSADGEQIGAALYADLKAALTEAMGHSPERFEGDIDELTEEYFAYLAILLQIQVDERHDRWLKDLAGSSMHQRISEAFREFVRCHALRYPLVLVWEDLHWADRSSLSVLQSLLTLPDEVPVALLLAFRAGEGNAPEIHEHITRTYPDRARLIELNSLSRDESLQLLGNLLDLNQTPPATREIILNRTDGNALFVEEVVRSLLDTQGGKAANGPGGVAASVASLRVPDTLYGVVMSRVDRLPSRDRRTLQAASVIGRAFERRLLAAILADEPEAHEIEKSLAELVRREFLLAPQMNQRETSPVKARGSEDAEYIFKHAVTVDVAYQSLLKSERRQLHRRVGEALEGYYADRPGELASTLAYHFESGAVPTKAFTYWVESANRALLLDANQEAVEAYRRALAVARSSAADGPATGKLAAVYEGLGDALYLLSQYGAAVEQFDRGLEFRDDAYQRAALHRKRGQAFEKWGRYDAAREAFEAALAEMGGMLDEAEAARIYSGLCLIHYHQGNLDAAAELANLALVLMTQLDNLRGIAQAYNGLGVVQARRGELEAAAESHGRALAVWQELKNTYGLAATHNNLGLVAQKRGDAKDAIAHFEEGVRLFEKLGNLHGAARVYDNISGVYAARNEPEMAMEYLKRAVSILADIGQDDGGYMPEMWQSGIW